MVDKHYINLDLVKMAQFVQQTRHCLDKLEKLIEQSLVEKDRIDRLHLKSIKEDDINGKISV
jgi:hypothetical protein